MTPLQTDRWLEMELGWFKPATFREQIDIFLERMAPLYDPVAGRRGVLFSAGMHVQLITLWSGDPGQRLPLGGRHYEGWEGADFETLRSFVELFHRRAEAVGWPDFRIGLACVGSGASDGMANTGDALYNTDAGEWFTRHPEVYRWPEGKGPPMPLAPLRGDAHPYATHPDGIPEGEPFADFLGGQWGELSRFCGFDAIVLRDRWLGSMLYNRSGRFGMNPPPDSEPIREETEAVTVLFRRIKAANPDVWVMGYSSAASAVGEWRIGCVDLEEVVADGAVDAFIDQTWAGAWQDFWSDTLLGWTFQLSNLLVHRAQIEGGNRRRGNAGCAHYFLSDTWDAWEPWDTLHQVPGKLAWGMWAFSHATFRGPEGDRRPDGCYLSWVNNRAGNIWSGADVEFLATTLNAAQADAVDMEDCGGPALVYARRALERIRDTACGEHHGEFIDDQVGLLNKWGFGCLSAARAEDGFPDGGEGLVFSLPDGTSGETDRLLEQIEAGTPVVLTGRADHVADPLIVRAGLERVPVHAAAGGYKTLTQSRDHGTVDLPVFVPTYAPIRAVDAEVLEAATSGPLLTHTRDGRLLYAHPQDWWQAGVATLRGSHLGNTGPSVSLVNAFHAARRAAGLWSIAPREPKDTLSLHVWRSGGCWRVLVGNLETGVMGDSRHLRNATLYWPSCLLPVDSEGVLVSGSGERLSGVHADRDTTVFEIPVPGDSYGIWMLL